MRLPAALERWASEHNDQLSEDTIAEVARIAAGLAASDLATFSVLEPLPELTDTLAQSFPPARAERAATLIDVVAKWAPQHVAAQAPPPAPPEPHVAEPELPEPELPEPEQPELELPALEQPEPHVAEPELPEPELPEPELPELEPPELELPEAVASETPSAVVPSATAPTYVPASLPQADRPTEDVEAPTFLRSDKVDQEDDERLYGPKRPWKPILASLAALAVLGAGIFAGWYWFSQRGTESDVTATAPEPTAVAQVEEPEQTTVEAVETPTSAPPPTQEPVALEPTYWADTSPILNAGTEEITASTYAVSPSNRAVLTGHTAAITGLIVSDEGRVLTSGADGRIVDWGADVTVSNPDVLNVPFPMTVLERTADQQLLGGDSDGSLTIINLVESATPVVLEIHDVAISAIAELSDQRVAVASVDGDVDVFDLGSPTDTVRLEHNNEVTAVAGLPDGRIATASVDGVVRLWPSDGGAPSEINTMAAPITALIARADGSLVLASVDGDLQIVDTDGDGPTLALDGHRGAIRALAEVTLGDGTLAIASGGDDTTVRLWNPSTGAAAGVLEGHGDIVSAIEELSDGRLVSASADGTGRLWDLTIEPSNPVIAPHQWNLSAMHPWDNDLFVTGGLDGHVVLASTAETTEPTLIAEHTAPVIGVSSLATGDIVSVDASSIMLINDRDGNAEVQAAVALAPGATAFDLRSELLPGDEPSDDPASGDDDDASASDDGAVTQPQSTTVVTGHADGSVRFHDLVDEYAVVEAHGSGVNDVAILSSGLVVSAGQDMTVRVIDPDAPETVPVFDLHAGPVDVVIELPDGRIASAGADAIYIWTVDGLAENHVRLNGQRSRTISLVALPGDRLISTGEDGRVRLWDLSTPESEPTTLVDIPGVVNPYLIQADNGLFVAGAARGYVVFTLS